MTKLEQVQSQYRKYRKWAYDSVAAAEYSLENVFKDEIPPTIHVDNHGYASHVFFNGQVLFFDEGIYDRLQEI
jgi:hypothetical protein